MPVLKKKNEFARFEVSTAMEIQVKVLWVVTLCSMDLQNVGILPQYTTSQPRRPGLETRVSLLESEKWNGKI
jgi:hypothetical protein